MKIDAHQHFWQYDPLKHNWIDDGMALLRQDFLPEDLFPLLKENSIDACIAVQADQSEGETHFLLNLAKQNNFIKGLVGWVDLRSPGLDERLEYYQQFREIKGFRHIVQSEEDVNFLIRPDFMRGIARLQAYNFTYDILIFPHQLGAALELIRRFPQQAFIIDHIAKPYIKDGFFDGWAVQMRACAQYDNVFCKVSGMLTEADWKYWKYEEFVPYLDLILEAFGSQRLVFGSDWPVCLLGGSYADVKSIPDQFFAQLSSAEQDRIMGANAVQFYNL